MAEYNDDLNYPDPFYISDIETYELLHVNEAGRRLFKVPLDADLEASSATNSCKGAMSRVRSARIICSASRKATCGNSRTFDEPSSSAERSSDQLGWEAGSS